MIQDKFRKQNSYGNISISLFMSMMMTVLFSSLWLKISILITIFAGIVVLILFTLWIIVLYKYKCLTKELKGIKEYNAKGIDELIGMFMKRDGYVSDKLLQNIYHLNSIDTSRISKLLKKGYDPIPIMNPDLSNSRFMTYSEYILNGKILPSHIDANIDTFAVIIRCPSCGVLTTGPCLNNSEFKSITNIIYNITDKKSKYITHKCKKCDTKFNNLENLHIITPQNASNIIYIASKNKYRQTKK